MSNTRRPATAGDHQARKRAIAAPKAPDSLSMHSQVEAWEDCCSCEAEPYWIEAMAHDQADDSADDDR